MEMENTQYIQTDLAYKIINFKESLSSDSVLEAVHCCIYSTDANSAVEDCRSAALIYMQMRFDGSIGFPGGLVRKGEDIVSALNRELSEEINLAPMFFVTKEDYLFTHWDSLKKRSFHFYAKEVSGENFKKIELNTYNAEDYGIETFGVIRVPLFVMKDDIRGFPTFLKNTFAGCAKDQLANFLLCKKIFSKEEIESFLDKSCK